MPISCPLEDGPTSDRIIQSNIRLQVSIIKPTHAGAIASGTYMAASLRQVSNRLAPELEIDNVAVSSSSLSVAEAYHWEYRYG